MYKKPVLIILFTALVITVKAQKTDPVSTNQPASRGLSLLNYPDTMHSPRKAVMHSLMVPGWGQLYNHQWWKVPIIYGGLGLIGSAIIFNQNYYKQFLTIAQYRRLGGQPNLGDKYYKEYMALKDRAASDTYVENALNSYRRNRDLAILGVLGGWGIQMIDAYIDAKFIHSYSMDDNLSFKITPGLIGQPVYAGNFNTAFVPAIKLTASF